MRRRGLLFRWFAVTAVSVYLGLAFAWLVATGKLPRHLLTRWIRSLFRRRYEAMLEEFLPDSGHCYMALLPAAVPSDADIGSRLVLLEDGRPLPTPHSGHDEIREHGRGRYSHWKDRVYFAASDDTDPRTNGRRYTVEER